MNSGNKKSKPSPRDLWKLLLGIIGAVAIVKELGKTKEERTWHGAVGAFPYDFRMPTIERMRETYWDPDGPILTSKVFGVGWAPNFGAVARIFGGSEKKTAA